MTLSSIEPEAVTWHWPGRLPAGKGVMIAGDPGVGKSILSPTSRRDTRRAATGRTAAGCPRGRCCCSWQRTGLLTPVRPRIDAHGGDASQVEILTAIQDKHSERPFNLSRDLAALNDALQRIRPKLLAIDPLNSYLGKVDGYRDGTLGAS